MLKKIKNSTPVRNFRNFVADSAEGLGILVAILTVIAVFLAVFFFMPFVLIWATNTISEAAGSDFYVEHGVLNYLAVIVIAAILKTIFGKKE